MKYEVEQKFPVEQFEPVESTLAELSATPGSEFEQVDCYLAHPARDFAVTDEALRVRRTGEKIAITYKGPRVDRTTKTRRELELPLPDGLESYSGFIQLLQHLGFRQVAEVPKRRRKAFVEWEGEQVEVSLDEVPGVGKFVELELIAEEDGLPRAREVLTEIAERLGLGDSERRSYLELLLISRSRGG